MSSSSSDDSSAKLDLLLDMNKNLLALLAEQNKQIQELQRENQRILADTTKMASHVDFINTVYARIRLSTFFTPFLI